MLISIFSLLALSHPFPTLPPALQTVSGYRIQTVPSSACPIFYFIHNKLQIIQDFVLTPLLTLLTVKTYVCITLTFAYIFP